jgi:outer membrane protein TolC
VTSKSWSRSSDDWNYGLALKWTFFEGRAGQAQVKKASSFESQLRAELTTLRANQERLTRDLQNQHDELQKQLRIVQEGAQLATTALKSQERDFRLGLITVLDLTTSDQQYLDLKLELLRIEHDLAKLYADALPLGLQLQKSGGASL